MPKALLLVFSAPSSPDRLDDYNKWYDEVHLAEVVAMDSQGGRRHAIQ